MKALKIIGGLLVAIIALALISAALISKDYSVEERVTIDRPLDEVYGFAKLLKNQGQYSKWQLMDPDMEHYYEGVDGTVGFVSGWKSDNPDVGEGEQEIIAIKDKERIDYELRFFVPFEASDKAYLVFKEITPNQTEVSWGFEGRMEYPMNLMIPLMGMETMIADDFQVGLQNLKGLLEN